ncbi:MAG: hypothetical protein AB1791_21535 [Chloroflexota bacterium]
MVTLTLSEDQVIDLVRQLPPDRKRIALLALAQSAYIEREARMQLAESQLRRVAAERGLDWDQVNELERELFIDDLIHEDRPCAHRRHLLPLGSYKGMAIVNAADFLTSWQGS